jgi:hypothetical protein
VTEQHLDLDTWRAFLERRLDAVAHDAALEHIASCPTCAAVFKAGRTAALEHVASAAPQPRGLRKLVFVPATLAVLIIGVVLIRDRSTPPVATTPPPVTAAPSIEPARPPARPLPVKPPVVIGAEQLLTMRGDAANTKYLEALADALRDYERNDFSTAMAKLKPLAEQQPQKFEPAFYLGASMLMSGRAAEAVPVLERALKLASAARRDDAERTLAAAREAARP